jgi:rhamnosyltransferase
MISIIIPTLNASRFLGSLLTSLRRQTIADLDITIVDSSSADETVNIARSHSASVHVIPKNEFDHGGTRTLIGKLVKGDILVYLTQDALPIDEYAVAKLVQPFSHDNQTGVAFGRQIPYPHATPFAKHLRYFNYPAHSYARTFEDRGSLGIRAAFCSNSFAAYRRSALEAVDWFQERLVMGEDLHASAKMLMKGYTLRYVAEAAVYHSHNYTVAQDLKRYFDLGRFFKRESWLHSEFGKPEREGLRFIVLEWSFLLKEGFPQYLPLSLARGMAKFVGYRLGLLSGRLPSWAVKRLSMFST